MLLRSHIVIESQSGIQICYDVEFPELPRLLAEQGMQILFVPFMTDTQNGYTRVRSCAQARAIENECYVAIAGSVGNLDDQNVHMTVGGLHMQPGSATLSESYVSARETRTPLLRVVSTRPEVSRACGPWCLAR